MRALLLLAIRLYWMAWPDAWKRGCLYRESCSRHVYRLARDEGLGSGLRALNKRYRTCRPGYGVFTLDGETRIALADGSVLHATEVAPTILAGHRSS